MFENDNAMIAVTDLTKRYAGRTAVAGISFTVARGEIVACSDRTARAKARPCGSVVFHAGDVRHGARRGL